MGHGVSMTSRDFCFWLQGFFEIQDVADPTRIASTGLPPGMNERQLDMVRRHLALVFKHEIDPSMGPPAHQQALDKQHAPQQVPAPGLSQQLEAMKQPNPGGLQYRC